MDKAGFLTDPIRKEDIIALIRQWEHLLDEKFPRESLEKSERDYRRGADAIISFLRARLGQLDS